MATHPSAPPVDHYENFPVASWLCPPRLRPAVAAIYWFARTADDIADEGDAPAVQRLRDLAAYREELDAAADGQVREGRWAGVFRPLALAIREHRLPVPLLHDLLSAFEQDVVQTRDGLGYVDRPALLDYCRRSANPVGRLMLHLYGVGDSASLARSDAICTALQLANFWQDLSRDLPRGRRYLPDADCIAHGVDPMDPAGSPAPRRADVVRDLCGWTRKLMVEGLPLTRTVPGRAGWELRAVAQGGLRVLDRIGMLGFDTFSRRPELRAWDWLVVAARTVRM